MSLYPSDNNLDLDMLLYLCTRLIVNLFMSHATLLLVALFKKGTINHYMLTLDFRKKHPRALHNMTFFSFQICCLPTGNEMQMCQSLASLVEALPSLQTLVLPFLDMYMLARTFKYFQYSSLDIQYKCATDQVFSYWGPEH